MTFTAIFILIFLIAFILIGGLVMYLSRTIDHGEARFGPDGKMISEREPERSEPIRPARRMEDTDKAGDEK
jgi:hypothetical protein